MSNNRYEKYYNDNSTKGLGDVIRKTGQSIADSWGRFRRNGFTADDYFDKIKSLWEEIENDYETDAYNTIPTQIQELIDGPIKEALVKFPSDTKLILVNKELAKIRMKALQLVISSINPNETKITSERKILANTLKKVWTDIENEILSGPKIDQDNIKTKIQKTSVEITTIQKTNVTLIKKCTEIIDMIDINIIEEYGTGLNGPRKSAINRLKASVNSFIKELTDMDFIAKFNTILTSAGYTALPAVKSVNSFKAGTQNLTAEDLEITTAILVIIDAIKQVDSLAKSMSTRLTNNIANMISIIEFANKKNPKNSKTINSSRLNIVNYGERLSTGSLIIATLKLDTKFMAAFDINDNSLKSYKAGFDVNDDYASDLMDKMGDDWEEQRDALRRDNEDSTIIREGIVLYLTEVIQEALKTKNKQKIISAADEFQQVYKSDSDVIKFVVALKDLIQNYL